MRSVTLAWTLGLLCQALLSSAIDFNSIEEYINSFRHQNVFATQMNNDPLNHEALTKSDDDPVAKNPPLLAMFPANEQHKDFDSLHVGDPLILTPLIESGKLDVARNLANIDNEFSSIESYTGFFTVNKKYNSNLYFWYIPAQVASIFFYIAICVFFTCI